VPAVSPLGSWVTPGVSNARSVNRRVPRPSKGAAALLKRLAKAHNNPELAEGLEGTWRREQIAAIVREMFRR
jgi:hypothetical protein